MQCEEYIYDGSCKAALHQHFTWHGARYFEVLGEAEVLEYCVAHTDIKKIISFKSSDPVLQWIFDAFIRTQLDTVLCRRTALTAKGSATRATASLRRVPL